jgi:hypothetical protein
MSALGGRGVIAVLHANDIVQLKHMSATGCEGLQLKIFYVLSHRGWYLEENKKERGKRQ